MKNAWIERVKENILPLSEEKENVKMALEEWSYLEGEVYEGYDYCQLCGHNPIIYNFKIRNIHNSNELFIGSECVKKFGGISVVDKNGKSLRGLEAKEKVVKDKQVYLSNKKTRSVIDSLTQLARKDSKFDIESFIKYHNDRGCFTPKQLVTIIWRLKKYNIPFEPKFFKITIRKQKEQEQLLQLKEFQIEQIWECLSPSQKDFFSNNHYLPAK